MTVPDDLKDAREAAARVMQEDGAEAIASLCRGGDYDDRYCVQVALRAIALHRARQEARSAEAGGFVLVPREPTPHMMLAARDHHSLPTSSEDHRVSIYRAMLAAAPPVPNCLRADADAELEELSAKAEVPDWAADSEVIRASITDQGCLVGWTFDTPEVGRKRVRDMARVAIAARKLLASRSGRLAPASSGQGDADGWRDDPSADDRWNAGLDFGQTQLCAVLGVDPATVNWDAATETLDGDVQSVIRGILTAGLGEDWLEQRPLPAAPVEPGR